MAYALNYENVNKYDVPVEITDGMFTSTSVLVIYVTDVNEAPILPRITASYYVSEMDTSQVLLGKYNATDPEEDMLTYSFVTWPENAPFTVTTTGELNHHHYCLYQENVNNLSHLS